MKKLSVFILLLFIVSSCVVQVKSIKDSSVIKPYQKALIVFPYQKGLSKTFAGTLRTKFLEQFKLRGKEVEIIIVNNEQELRLNAVSEIEQKINEAIKVDSKDIVFMLRPIHLSYQNGILVEVTYQMTGIDVLSKREVWTSEFTSGSSFGPLPNKIAKSVVAKLKLDRMI